MKSLQNKWQHAGNVLVESTFADVVGDVHLLDTIFKDRNLRGCSLLSFVQEILQTLVEHEIPMERRKPEHDAPCLHARLALFSC